MLCYNLWLAIRNINFFFYFQIDDEGWEYARSHKGPYHSTSDKFDSFKRRRKLKEMIPVDPKKLYHLPVFNFKGKRKLSGLAFLRKKVTCSNNCGCRPIA